MLSPKSSRATRVWSVVALIMTSLIAIGCSEAPPQYKLHKYGAKITEESDGISVDLRSSPAFSDDAVELLEVYGDRIVDLTLQDVAITDEAIKKLKKLTNVRRLILNDTEVSGSAFATMAEMPFGKEISVIGMRNNEVSGADLEHLENLPMLSRVDLSGTNVHDDGLEFLQGERWRMVDLTDTKVTPEGVASLRKRIPMADIRH